MAACTRCSARLTLHLRARRLRCHHCGLEQVPPLRCPACGNADLQPVGQGTQRIEDVLARRFPHVRLLRIDRDSTQRKGSFAAALEDIHAGRADLLIGTQMLAKGHDFPRLTLVVVVGADSGLYATDFRAAERLYALLVQVAGRAGRASHPGQVLIQTAFPEHPFYAALVRDDYAAFARLECIERRRAGFPPFVHQALLRADAPGVEAALAWLDAARSTLPETADVQVFDPVPAVMLRVNGRERAQLLLQSTNRRALQALLAVWMPTLRTLKPGVVRWSLDVDPIDL
jgi:primosomal protein N' (replication factor Y)